MGCYEPPAKCYVCYPKPDVQDCDILTTLATNTDVIAFKAFWGTEKANQWVKAYKACKKKCPTTFEELKTYVTETVDLMLKTGEVPEWICSRGSCKKTISCGI